MSRESAPRGPEPKATPELTFDTPVKVGPTIASLPVVEKVYGDLMKEYGKGEGDPVGVKDLDATDRGKRLASNIANKQLGAFVLRRDFKRMEKSVEKQLIDLGYSPSDARARMENALAVIPPPLITFSHNLAAVKKSGGFKYSVDNYVYRLNGLIVLSDLQADLEQEKEEKGLSLYEDYRYELQDFNGLDLLVNGDDSSDKLGDPADLVKSMVEFLPLDVLKVRNEQLQVLAYEKLVEAGMGNYADGYIRDTLDYSVVIKTFSMPELNVVSELLLQLKELDLSVRGEKVDPSAYMKTFASSLALYKLIDKATERKKALEKREKEEKRREDAAVAARIQDLGDQLNQEG